MAIIHVDGQTIEADENTNLLQACLQAGLDLPYFCWHPALGSVGACRQCAVIQYEDEDDDEGQLVMACMTPAADGTRITLADEQSSAFRSSVIEWMMASHPHDCPVCEEGGHCHLQDMTVMTGHNYRSHRFTKRTFRNQDLGPFINHEMNRCITCYRCTRFYNDYAGGGDLAALGQRDLVYFGRHADGPLESEFSGNLVEVCPTGVFSDKTLSKRYSRKWDMRAAPSVCTHCALGCNISPAERYGTLKCVTNRYNGEVNGYFLCDRGRFGYDHVNHPARIRQPMLRRDGTLEPASMEEIGEALADTGPLIGIGSPRAAVETNYVLKKLVGADNFHTGMNTREQALVERAAEILRRGPATTPPLRHTERADAVLVLGEDVTWTAPILALSLRQAVRNAGFERAADEQVPAWNDAMVRELSRHERSPLFELVPWRTGLNDCAAESVYRLPEDIAGIGQEIAHCIDQDAPAAEGLDEDDRALARRIADALCNAERPLIVSGTGLHSRAVLDAAADISRALCRRGAGNDKCRDKRSDQVGLTLVLPESNSLGAVLLGGGDLESALQRVAGDGGTLLVAENDLWRRADHGLVQKAFERAERLIVLDALGTATVESADIVLPAGTFADADGTRVNNEGRAQRFFRVFEPDPRNDNDNGVRDSWRWLTELAPKFGCNTGISGDDFDAVVEACASECEALADIGDAAPVADHRRDGLRTARAPFRYSGRTASHADETVHEPTPPADNNAPLSFSMEGLQPPDRPPPAAMPFAWSPGWNSGQAINKFQHEIGGALIGGDPGVRLIEAAEGSSGDGGYTGDASEDEPTYASDPDAYRLLIRFEFLGSEELSAWSAPIRQRVASPFAGLAAETLDRLGLEEGGAVELAAGDDRLVLPARVIEGLSGRGVVLPAYLNGGITAFIAGGAPATVRLHAAGPDGEGSE